MAKTKRKMIRRRSNVRRKPITRRQARGKEHLYPFLIKTMLNKAHLDTHRREFHDTGLTTKILSYLPPLRDIKYLLTD